MGLIKILRTITSPLCLWQSSKKNPKRCFDRFSHVLTLPPSLVPSLTSLISHLSRFHTWFWTIFMRSKSKYFPHFFLSHMLYTTRTASLQTCLHFWKWRCGLGEKAACIQHVLGSIYGTHSCIYLCYVHITPSHGLGSWQVDIQSSCQTSAGWYL